jgi:hypothetical protein
VGALAVLCGGLAGCFQTDKKPLAPPPQAKGTGERPTTVGVFDKNGQLIKTGTVSPGGMTQTPQYPGGTAGITATQGQFPQSYQPQGPRYDPLAPANSMNPGVVGTPTRQMSATQFNNQPGTGPLAPPVNPAGGAYNPGSMAPSGPNYGQPTGGTTTNYRRDPTPPPLTDLPVPPAAPPGLAPAVGPANPPGTPVPTMSVPPPSGSSYLNR